eukprot:UN02443
MLIACFLLCVRHGRKNVFFLFHISLSIIYKDVFNYEIIRYYSTFHIPSFFSHVLVLRIITTL